MPGRLMARYVTRTGGAAHARGQAAHAHRVYEEARGARRAPAGRVLAVGDSMAHDVAGANRAGVDSALVCWGIHAAEGVARRLRRRAADAARLAAFLAAFEPRDRPTFVLPAFAPKSSVVEPARAGLDRPSPGSDGNFGPSPRVPFST